MKLWVMSDLHLEMFETQRDRLDFIKELVIPRHDALILAGDIFLGVWSKEYLEILDTFLEKTDKLLFVAGNHEYYNSQSIQTVNSIFRDFERRNKSHFYFLNDFPHEELIIDGVSFIGTTLWFNTMYMTHSITEGFTDFEYIPQLMKYLRETHNLLVDYLKKNITDNSVVITHHLPSNKSVAKEWKYSSSNKFFINDMENVINVKQPKLWIHGHTHSICDYYLGETRVVCNPRGYEHELEKATANFKPDLVIEI